MSDVEDDLISKIKILSDTVWDGRATHNQVQAWLNNFSENEEGKPSERLHALYILSQFMYFSSPEIKELLKSVFRDLVKYPIVENIRKTNRDTVDTKLIGEFLAEELKLTKFLGVGNPSESGSHLLYYFRQENNLPKDMFITTYEIFDLSIDGSIQLANPELKRYIFIDDFCGGGTQATRYISQAIRDIKAIDPNVEISYYVLFGNEDGLEYLAENTQVNRCDAIFRLDKSYKCFGEDSRHAPDSRLQLDWDFAEKMALKYGKELYEKWPLGHSHGQLLLGLFHNTPNNSLPIIWLEDKQKTTWEPIFRRYPKVYGERP